MCVPPCCQIRKEAERQARTHLSAEQEERKRLAQQSEQLVQSVQAHQATLHALQEQQTEHSVKRLHFISLFVLMCFYLPQNSAYNESAGGRPPYT